MSAVNLSQASVRSRDGTSLALTHYRNGYSRAVVVCPGFFNSRRNRWIRRTAELFAELADVIVFDFRGHGQSGGWFTWSAREPDDVEAVVGYAVQCGYASVGILGYSLGAASALVAASRRRQPVQSVLGISGPSAFWEINFHFWKPEVFSDLFDNMSCNWEGKGCRPHHPFFPKTAPIHAVSRLSQVPVWFVHGTRDWIITDGHSRRLYAACPSPSKRLIIIEQGLHAERMVQQFPERMHLLVAEWVRQTMPTVSRTEKGLAG